MRHGAGKPRSRLGGFSLEVVPAGAGGELAGGQELAPGGAVAGDEGGIGADDMPGGVDELAVAVTAFPLEAAVGFVLGELEPLHEDGFGALDGLAAEGGLPGTPELSFESVEVVRAGGGQADGGDEGLGGDGLDQVNERAGVECELDRLAGAGRGEDDEGETDVCGSAGEGGGEGKAAGAGSEEDDRGTELANAVVGAAGGEDEGPNRVAGVVQGAGDLPGGFGIIGDDGDSAGCGVLFGHGVPPK